MIDQVLIDHALDADNRHHIQEAAVSIVNQIMKIQPTWLGHVVDCLPLVLLVVLAGVLLIVLLGRSER